MNVQEELLHYHVVGIGVGGDGGVSKMLKKFYVKCLVMGKALAGELSCTRNGLVYTYIYSNIHPYKCMNLHQYHQDHRFNSCKTVHALSAISKDCNSYVEFSLCF